MCIYKSKTGSKYKYFKNRKNIQLNTVPIWHSKISFSSHAWKINYVVYTICYFPYAYAIFTGRRYCWCVQKHSFWGVNFQMELMLWQLVWMNGNVYKCSWRILRNIIKRFGKNLTSCEDLMSRNSTRFTFGTLELYEEKIE